ncbi:MAG: alkaline phosphatase family protein [Candidatus Korobacteraceae bacterium]
MRQFLATTLMAVITFGPLVNANAAPVPAPVKATAGVPATPIQHLVVIFQENVSFDHYFGTYPNATNPQGEPPFTPLPNTPGVNGIAGTLSSANPNLNPANGQGATNPFRLDRSQASTNDQDHDYTPEQMAFDGGLMDLFPANTGVAGPPPGGGGIVDTTGLVMGYYDGNTVTALWNYAQYFAMSDNSYGTNFGPSTDGALNLISGQTNGVIQNENGTGSIIGDGNGGFTLISDADPIGDSCSTTSGEVLQMGGQTIGDLLNTAGVSWGFFEGGFDLTATNPNGTTGCNRSTTSQITGQNKKDYIPHHQPFQYYASTANLQHTRPTSVLTIGQQGDAGNHQYDTHDFFDAVNAGNFPSVVFLKAPGYQDGHAGYSDPIDEQKFIVDTINFLAQTRYWATTAVVINYDDSDGWYDHQLGQIVNTSQTSADGLNGAGHCGTQAPLLAGIDGNHAQGRCGYGPRIPMMVVSPYARQNYVDHTMTDQTSILRFIEDNWLNGQRIGNGSFDTVANSIASMLAFQPNACIRFLLLDDNTGLVTGKGCASL